LPLDAKPEAIAAAVKKVKAAGMTLYAGGVIYMQKEAEVRQAFEYAKAAGMQRIVIMAAPPLLGVVNEHVQQYDIPVCIHNHGPDDKVWPTPRSIYAKIRGLDPRVGLCMDIGHTVRAGDDPSESAEKCADRLFDLHMKDVTAATRKGRGTVVGRGVIDIPKLLKTLLAIHYAGVVSFECEEAPADPLPGLAESAGYVKGVLAAI
jgi:sugar phosphate isomerase/epimerase